MRADGSECCSHDYADGRPPPVVQLTKNILVTSSPSLLSKFEFEFESPVSCGLKKHHFIHEPQTVLGDFADLCSTRSRYQ